MTRLIKVSVSDELYAALVAEAERELRNLPNQVRWRLMMPLVREGTVTVPPQYHDSTTEVPPEAHDSTMTDPPAEDVEDMLLAADEMDDSGDLMRRNTPAAKRRKAQIEALQRAWEELFPNQPPLTETSAKDWLRLKEDLAAGVYFAMQKATKANHPVSYIRRILQTEREEDLKMAAIAEAPVSVTVTKRDQDDLTNWRWTEKTAEQRKDEQDIQRWCWEHGRPGTDDTSVWTHAVLLELYPTGEIPARGCAADGAA